MDHGAGLTEMALLGTLAIRTGRMLERDAKAMKITNDAEADGYVDPPYRDGWSIRDMKGKRAIRAGAAIGGLLLLALALIAFWPVDPPALPAMPDPNGYEDLVAACEFVPQDKFDEEAASLDDLRAHLSLHGRILAGVREAMKKECRVPVENTLEFLERHPPSVWVFSMIARLFHAEFILAREEGRLGDAMRSCLDLILFSRKVRAGGLVMDYLAGAVIETFGIEDLRTIREHLGGRDRTAAIGELEAHIEAVEPVDRCLEREHDIVMANSGPIGRISLLFYWSGMTKMYRRTGHRHACRSRLLLVDLALRAHRDDHGAFPASLVDLVPGYLKALPADPFTGEPFIYRPGPDGFTLYSPGRDRRDDGGDAVTDLLLEDDEEGAGD